MLETTKQDDFIFSRFSLIVSSVSPSSCHLQEIEPHGTFIAVLLANEPNHLQLSKKALCNSQRGSLCINLFHKGRQ